MTVLDFHQSHIVKQSFAISIVNYADSLSQNFSAAEFFFKKRFSILIEFLPQFFKGFHNIRVWMIQIVNPFKLFRRLTLKM